MKTVTPQSIFVFVRDYNIATNPAPEAIFDPLTSGFNLWATPTDHPAGHEWNDVVKFMDQGAYTKKCAFVGTAWFNSHKGIVELETDAYIMQDRMGLTPKQIANRPADLEWCKQKIAWVFDKMSAPCPPIKVVEEQ